MATFRRTYNRPYVYYAELRIFAVYKSEDHTIFVGTGMADDAIAFVEKLQDSDGHPVGTLTKLESHYVTRGEYDQLITDPITAEYPYRIYVVNPDDEGGKASNAIEFEKSDQIPLLDVRVDGQSVVKDQVAYIDLTGKLDQIREPNKIYGTDEDGREVVFDRAQIEGVQHVILNDEELPIVDGTVQFDDIAFASQTVPRVTSPDVLYGTDINGNQVTYSRFSFATSDEMGDVTTTVGNKQDKDMAATDGMIAIMKNHQSVGSNVSLDSVTSDITNIKSDMEQLENKVEQGITQVGEGVDKDWKAVSGNTAIKNHPVSASNASVAITNLNLGDELPFRTASSAVTVASSPISGAPSSVSVGSSTTAGANSVAIGTMPNAAENAIAIGGSANAGGTYGIALGNGTIASQPYSAAFGPNANAIAQSCVAIGYNSVANEQNTVSVGNTSGTLRRIVNVQDPVNDQDAVTLKFLIDYVTEAIGGEPPKPPTKTYTVTFDSAGGSTVPPQTVKDGEKAKEPAQPTREDFTFNGWFLEDSPYSFDTPVTSNITLVAKWTANAPEPTTYTVTFDSQGGTPVQPQQVQENDKATKPEDPTREGYKFNGWLHDGEPYDFDTPVTSNITLTASWATVKAGLPTYVVNSLSDSNSVQGEQVRKPCLLVIADSDAPQFVYDNSTNSVGVDSIGLPTYVVNNASDPQSVDGATINKPCMLVVIGSDTPQFVYDNSTASNDEESVGLPVYAVNSTEDAESIQGDTIKKPCMLVVVGSNPPQFVYSK